MYLFTFCAVVDLNSYDLNLSIPSILQRSRIKRLVSVSVILRNRYKMSGIMWLIGMDGNKGWWMQPYSESLIFTTASRLISSIVLIPSSIVHHDFEVLCLCSAGHLHHTHENLALAACIPAQIARYFMSAHIKFNVEILSIDC